MKLSSDHDFYYSRKCEIAMRKAAIMNNKPYHDNYFNGHKYTECIEAGKTPMTSHYDDLVKIGTGTFENVVII